MKTKKKDLIYTTGDKIFICVINIFMIIAMIIVAVPVLNVIASSFSSPKAVAGGKVGIWPVGFTLKGYQLVLENGKLIIGYKNTIFYTVAGTALNIFMTTIAAYPLSRRDFKAGGVLMKIYTFTMYFGGGIIPSYLLMRSLGLINTRWAMILPGAISVYNMIVMRTYFQTNIPTELLESTKIDGCSDFRFLVQFAVPLSKAIMAVMVLFYAIGHWNDFFNAYLYISDEKKYPLSIFFQMLLGGVITKGMDTAQEGMFADRQDYNQLLKYSLIMLTCVPVWCVYPFIQKYFVQGVMIGSLKG